MKGPSIAAARFLPWALSPDENLAIHSSYYELLATGLTHQQALDIAVDEAIANPPSQARRFRQVAWCWYMIRQVTP